MPRAQLLISPRVGVSWIRDYEHGQLTVDGGVGVFTGQVPFVWIVNNYSNTGVEQKGLRLTAKSEGGQVVEPAAKFSTTPSPTSHSNTQFMLNAMNEKFRYPQNLKANVAVGYATDDGWSLRAEALYTKTLHNAVFRNLAVLAEEGRIVKLFFPDEVAHYDANIDGHYHFVCKRCAKIIDLSVNKRVLFPPREDFVVDTQEVNLYGHCRECCDCVQS